jgi:hypothetical protein
MPRLALFLGLTAAPLLALAHAGERGFIMLLPTGLYIAGGALAVLLSFVVIALLPSRFFSSLAAKAYPQEETRAPLWPSIVSMAVLGLLVFAGGFGSRDPLDNPLPLVVWTLGWVGFTFLTALLGNLWGALNPFRVFAVFLFERRLALHPGYWPAVALLFCFTWFELVHPSPQDPMVLASAVLGYTALTAVAMTAFGARDWLERGDAFSVFFRLVARLAPPWRGLLRGDVLPASAMAFVLLALASVSFDGLSRTFWWLGLIGANPLEHPGRSDLVVANTLGLVAVCLLFVLLYVSVAKAGATLGKAADPGYGYYVVAIVPIAIGYHFAHYFPTFLVDAQHALRALSDPFELGWNLLGTRDMHVRTSFLTHHGSIRMIWNMQVAAIVAAHVAAVFVAHVLALRRHASARAALVSQVPMTGLMVGYTVFGLWLLSTPVAG